MTLSLKSKLKKTLKRHSKRKVGGGIFGFGNKPIKQVAPQPGTEVAPQSGTEVALSPVTNVALSPVTEVIPQSETNVAPQSGTNVAPRSGTEVAPQSETNVAPTPAITNNGETCDKTSKNIEAQLKKNKIKAISSAESKTARAFTGNAYDKVNRRAEVVNAALNVLYISGFLAPGVPQIVCIGRAMVLGVTKYQKNKELSYLSSECLSFVANISRDLAQMYAFYSLTPVINKRVKIDAALYEVLVKNLFKFLYFLIDSIDFTNTALGPHQYLFWQTFLARIDFSTLNYTKTIEANTYRYSCAECIPNELRKKLRETSKVRRGSIPYKELVNLETNSSRYRKEQFKLYGFCSDAIVDLCRNQNDIIMRLIEVNIYKLIDSTYKNRSLLAAKLQKDKTFLDEFFRSPKIDDARKNELQKEINYPNGESGATESSICFDFLIELNRIISELDYRDISTDNSNKFSNKFADGTKNLLSGVKTFFGNAITQYNKLLREYVMMTGNFAMMTSRYVLDYNAFSESDKTDINEQVETKLGEVATELNEVIQTTKTDAVELSKAAAQMPTLDEVEQGQSEAPPSLPPSGGNNSRQKKYFKKLKSNRKRSKSNRKKYKRSKKYNK